MLDTTRAFNLPTLASAVPSASQRRLAVGVSLGFAAISLALLPIVSQQMAPMPGFIPSYQAALILVYAVTTYLFFAQYHRTRSVPLLVLGAGSLYTTLIVAVQLLTFPNVFGTGRILGSGPETTTWLWTLWHFGPPLFAVPYAIMEGDQRPRHVAPNRVTSVGRLVGLGVGAAVTLLTVLVVRYVDYLPKSVEGDCQRAPKSPQLWAFKIPYPAGSMVIGDQPAI